MLSKTAEYALRAVACMGNSPDTPLSADALAGQTQVPRRYLTRVLQDLCASGIARSRPGPGGGYELAQATDALTMLDVVNSVAPVERITKCPLGLTTHKKLCPLHTELDKTYAAIEASLGGVTIQELVNSSGPIVPLCEVK